jgi:hypothetical protein
VAVGAATTAAGTSTAAAVTTATAAPARGRGRRRQKGRRPTALWAALAAAPLLGAGIVVLALSSGASGAGDAEPTGPQGFRGTGAAVGLPGSVSGLPARSAGTAADAAGRLQERLSQDAAVSDVVIELYGTEDESVLVVLVTPVQPFSERTAGELTARLIGAAGPERGMADDVRSSTSADGDALITCSTPHQGTSTCVTVEPDLALVVLTSGLRDRPEQDPVAVAEDVRASVLAGMLTGRDD